MRDQAFHRQTPLAEEVDVIGDIALWQTRAHVGAFEGALFGGERDLRDGELVVGIRQTGGDGGAAAASDLIGERQGRSGTGGFESEIDTAARGFFDFGDNVGSGGVEGIGGTEFLSEVRFAFVEIDGEDAAGTCDDCAENAT